MPRLQALALLATFSLGCSPAPPPAPLHVSAQPPPVSSPAPIASPSPAASASATPPAPTCRDASECVTLGEAASSEAQDFSAPHGLQVERRTRALAYFRQACKLNDANGCALAADAYSIALVSNVACRVKYAQRACELGKLESCAAAAYHLCDGRELPKDLPRAVSLLTKACDGGVLGACDTLGSMFLRGEGVRVDAKQGMALRHKACDGGLSESCFSLGTSYRYGAERVPKSPERAAKAYQRACELSLGVTDPAAASLLQLRSCDPYAGLLAEGRWVKKNEALAARFWDPACSQGAFETCFPLARLLAAGRGVPRDSARAAELIETACGNSFGAGCFEGAAMFRAGSGVPKDLARADALEEKGVEWAASGCVMHGGCDGVVRYYQARTSVPPDPAVALSRIEKACALGFVAGCRLAAQRHGQGVWVTKDAQRAAKFEARARDLSNPARTRPMLEQGCAANLAEDCYLLGNAYRNGDAAWKIPKDEARARELLAKACAASGDDMAVECRLTGSIEPSAEQLKAQAVCAQQD